MNSCKNRMRVVVLGLTALLLSSSVVAAGQDSKRASTQEELNYLYRVVFLQAKPAGLAPMLELLQSDQAKALWKQQGQARPMMLRHSQGDAWDLMLMYPIKSYADYYSASAIERRDTPEQEAFSDLMDDLTVSEEVLFSYGEDLEAVQAAYDANGFFHIEIFDALNGKKDELFQQRVMENVYATALGRPGNFIFLGDQGTDGDNFTIGYYKNLQDYAGVDLPVLSQQEKREAAIAAGFENETTIGTYLRELLFAHHDTLAVKVK